MSEALELDVVRAFTCEGCRLVFRSRRLVPDCPRCWSWWHACRPVAVSSW